MGKKPHNALRLEDPQCLQHANSIRERRIPRLFEAHRRRIGELIANAH